MSSSIDCIQLLLTNSLITLINRPGDVVKWNLFIFQSVWWKLKGVLVRQRLSRDVDIKHVIQPVWNYCSVMCVWLLYCLLLLQSLGLEMYTAHVLLVYCCFSWSHWSDAYFMYAHNVHFPRLYSPWTTKCAAASSCCFLPAVSVVAQWFGS